MRRATVALVSGAVLALIGLYLVNVSGLLYGQYMCDGTNMGGGCIPSYETVLSGFWAGISLLVIGLGSITIGGASILSGNRHHHRIFRAFIWLPGLVLAGFSWTLQQGLLWNALGPVEPNWFGEFAFGLTSTGWTVFFVSFGLGLAILLSVTIALAYQTFRGRPLTQKENDAGPHV